MVQHISVRVPWHDNGWNGNICIDPCRNNACLRLKNIYENRDDQVEASLCGQCMSGNESSLSCIGEGAAFMSPVPLVRSTVHPYKYSSPATHSHFLETEIIYPAYSFPCRPFAWMMRDNAEIKRERYNIPFIADAEPVLGFNTNWLQEASNQKAVFDYFYSDVVPDKSLCIAYAKQVPFVEDYKRVVVAIGHVKKIIPAVEHNHFNEHKLRSMTWETHVCHSIRPDHKDGFVIPYDKMMEYAESHPDFDINSIIVFAPEDAFNEFSFATEHVSYDATIDVILSCIKAFEIINQCLDEDYSDVLEWLNARLSETWEERGAFPGLGAMLTALEIPLGVLIARNITNASTDIWDNVEKVFDHPDQILPPSLAKQITPLMKKTWKNMSEERKTLFRLLSRFSITIDQAKVLFFDNERRKAHICCSDKDIIDNPYILYEQTRLKQEALYVSVKKVDRAVFPVPSIQEQYPLPEPSCLNSENDQRRIRAIAISVLEAAANDGHTILPCTILIDEIHKLTLNPPCPVTSDILNAIDAFQKPHILKREMKDGTEYYKLVRLNDFDEIIENRISKRISASDLPCHADWRALLDKKFGILDNGAEQEKRAREEKAACLKVLATSRISVLIGDAGTGKTTVLSVLCEHPEIKVGGILLLAPTGKATVRLLDSMGSNNSNFTALNVAQFLVRSGRFDWDDMRYSLSDTLYGDVPETVIIDEASMLTEEMFGALLQALKKAKRIIFVGDPNQLPPIGAGRPFVDLVYSLRSKLIPNAFPRTCPHYGELTVNRRQKADDIRLDVKLSKMFTSSEENIDDDVITEIAKNKSENIRIETWSTKEELETKLFEIVSEVAGMKNVDDQEGFDLSLGGTKGTYGIFFNQGAASFAENWQILAPVRNMPQGVMNLNRQFHLKYREKFLEVSKHWGAKKRIANSIGPEGIVYGDKVINVINTSKKEAWPNAGARDYIANGEIGIACGDYSANRKNNFMHVEFSSQKGFLYSFDGKDFDEENGTAQLELAYALTVHKAQGSQFNTVILVLAEPCRILSREMLYTALTRQLDRIIILYNQEPYHLRGYSSAEYSSIATRYSDLFANVFSDNTDNFKPQISKVGNRYYEERMIHKTVRGELVRSKSEVVIANALHYLGIDYEYEPSLVLEGKTKFPDFKIVDYDTGETWYWEHCGMMTNPLYKKHWEEKKAFYAKNGIEEGKNLIVTYDEENGAINSACVDELIHRYLL